MPIYEMTADVIREISQTSFSKENLKERTDIQRLFQECIQYIAPGTMVLTEEFGGWVNSARRIDLLCLHETGTLVVVELKRTEDGGHMDLQAIRYAAMVSPMTFEQAVNVHREYLRAKGRIDVDAQSSIMKFLNIDQPREFNDPVRIVLAAANFSKEITTSVLWLNSFNLDIRCVRLQPYSYESGKILLDIQQVIPLPEAADYQIAIQHKSAETRAAIREGRDYSKFDLTIDGVFRERLSKREFVFYVIQAAIRRGLKPADIQLVMPWKGASLFFAVAGKVDSVSFEDALPNRNPERYFCSDTQLFYLDGQTFALTNQWGPRTEDAVKAVMALLGPQSGITYEKISR